MRKINFYYHDGDIKLYITKEEQVVPQNSNEIKVSNFAIKDFFEELAATVDTDDYRRNNVPCPTCHKPGDFSKFIGNAVEKVIWEDYPEPYSKLKKAK